MKIIQTIIAIIGLASFAGMFIGTAIALLFVSFKFAVAVFIASLLVFIFALIIENNID